MSTKAGQGQFGGNRRDTGTGNYKIGARVYQPGTGTWATQDNYRAGGSEASLSVVVDPLTANRYNYVNGDPINLTDPTGHGLCDICGKAIKTVKHHAGKGVKAVKSTAGKAVKTVKNTAGKGVKLVKDNAGTIVKTAAVIGAGVGAFAACTGATAGVGVVGCAAVGGAAAGAVKGALNCAGKSAGDCAKGVVIDTVVGAAAGAVGGGIAGQGAGIVRAVASGAAAGATDSAGSQFAHTGRVDLGDVAQSAVLGGLTAGGVHGGMKAFGGRGTSAAADAEPALSEGYNGAMRDPATGRFAKNPNRVARPTSDGVHGNSRMSTAETVLYRLEDIDGNYLKTGITSNPSARYPKSFMADKTMDILSRGSRSDMLDLERSIVSSDPGPLNHEPWAGSVS